MQDKQFAILNNEVKAVSDDDRILRFIGTTATRDRMGDEITVKGWQLKNYLKNPTFLWSHNYGELPIGKAVNVEKTDNALIFDIEFAPADANPKAEQIYKLYKGGFLRATSVGFRSLESDYIDEESDEEKKRKKKEPDVEAGKVFKKQELLELSAVPVPANPDALMVSRKKGMTMPEELHAVLDEYIKTKDHEALRNWARSMDYTPEGELIENQEKAIKDNNPFDLDELAEKIVEKMRSADPEAEPREEPEEDPEKEKEKEENNDGKPDSEESPEAQPEGENADAEAEAAPKATAEGANDEAEAQPPEENADAEDDEDDEDYIEIVDD